MSKNFVYTEKVTGAIVQIPIELLHHHHDNPRKELGDLTELTDSIKAKGVLQNLTVVPYWFKTTGVGCDEPEEQAKMGYLVVIGNRRLEAAKAAGLTTLPCIIAKMSPAEQVQTMLLENMQRSDLTVYEQAQGFQMMLDLGDTVEGISEKTGFSKTTVRRRLKMAELNQDTLKEVSCRQLSLLDFDRLNEIKDLKKRNKVLEQIGTNNFEAVFLQAKREQEREENIKRWREELEKYNATEISEKEVHSAKYTFMPYVFLSENPEEKLKELFVGDGPFYYCITNYGYLYLRKAKSQDEVNAASERDLEREREEAKRRQKESALREAFARTYELRYKFIKNFTEITAKKCVINVARSMLISIYFAASMPDTEDLAGLLGFSIADEDDCEDTDIKALTDISVKPYRVLIAIAYSFFNDNERNDCYNSWLNKYQKNESLSRLYDFLAALGYEMSDEEIGLMDGTSALYSDGDDENAEVENTETELLEEEELSDEDEPSEDDADYDKMIDKLCTEYEGDADEE